MPRYTNYKLTAGLNTNSPSNTIGDQSQLCSGLLFDNSSPQSGYLKSMPVDNTVYTNAGTVTSISVLYTSATRHIVSTAATGLYSDDYCVGNIPYGKYSICEHNQALYFCNSSATPFKMTCDGKYNMGSPTPTSAPTIASAGTGDMNGNYKVAVTFVTEHSNVNEGKYQTESAPYYSTELTGLSSASILVTAIPTNSDTAYNVVARRLYLYGGRDPSLTSYYRVYLRDDTEWKTEIADNTTTSATISLVLETSTYGGVDLLTELDTDNSLPPHGSYIVENFDHFCIANDDRWYYSKVGDENIPTNNNLKDKSTIMGMVEYDNVVYTPTKDTLYIKTGSSESNFYNQRTEITDGCVAPFTVCGSPFGLAYLSHRGVVLYGSSTAQEPVIVSQDVGPVFRELPSAYLTNAYAVYYNGRYYISLTESGYTSNNVTYVFDSITKGWSKIPYGYNCFARDPITSKLYAGYGSYLVELGGGTTYQAWEYKSGDYEVDPDINGFPKGIDLDIDTKGEDVTVTMYYDNVAQTTFTVNTSTRQKIYRRIPNGTCHLVSLKLSQAAASTQTVIYNFAIDVRT